MALRREPKSIWISALLFVLCVGLMAYLRVYIYGNKVVTLSYGIPLLVCLWHRDRRLLWTMAVTFLAMASFKAYYLLPSYAVDLPVYTQLVMQCINTLVIASVVDVAMNFMERQGSQNRALEHANEELSAREEEISRQNEELQVQSEELARQNEELQQQAEEAQQQGEELQTQKESLQYFNEELQRREAILQMLLKSLQTAEHDGTVLDDMACSILHLFHKEAVAVALVMKEDGHLDVRACAGDMVPSTHKLPFAGSFASLVMEQNKIAYVDDLAQRADLHIQLGKYGPFRTILAAPIHLGGIPSGAVEIYGPTPRQWTKEHFRIIEWVAAKCSVIIEIRHLHEKLLQVNTNLETTVALRTAELQQAVSELEHFSYSITHDMRAPLRAMRGFADLLANDGDLSEADRKDFLNRIITAAGRMDRLITDALNYTKSGQEDMKLTPVDPNVLIEGMIQSYPAFQPPRAEIRIDGKLPNVLANEAGLTQCFSNLLNNAVKFVKPGSVPRVIVRVEEADGGMIRLLFEDNGIGIPEAMHSRIFGMFQRASRAYEGTGIGLALVKKVVERMSGKVGVESVEGKGSLFWLELKAAKVKA